MRTTIDAAGRVVIPKSVRSRLGLDGHHQVEITDRGDHIEIAPVPSSVRLEERDGVPVAVPDDDALPRLSTDDVRAAVERSRR